MGVTKFISTQMNIVFDPACGPNISKVLLVYNANGAHQQAMFDFLSKVLGYHVVLLRIDDAQYDSVGAFIKEFETITRKKGASREYVFAVFHFSQHERRVRCLHCTELRPDSSKLLKHAFASAYVAWGQTRCAIVHPAHCCQFDSTLLPKQQIEDMSIRYDTSAEHPPSITNTGSMKLVSAGETNTNSLDTVETVAAADTLATANSLDAVAAADTLADTSAETAITTYAEVVWRALADKLSTVKTIDSHKEATRHVRTLEEVVPVIVEDPLTRDEVLQLLGKYVGQYPGQDKSLAKALGTPPIEWDEHAGRAGDRALYLVLRRTILDDATDGYAKISAWLMDNAYLAASQLCRDSAASDQVYLSKYPSLTDANSNGGGGGGGGSSGNNDASSEFVGGNNAFAPPNASEGTHLEKVRTNFLPPHIRDAMLANVQEGEKKVTEETIAKAQEMDREYERRRLAREMQEYRGEVSGGSTLLGGFSTREQLPGQNRGRGGGGGGCALPNSK